MAEIRLLLQYTCMKLEVTNGNGRVTIHYAPIIKGRRIGPFGVKAVDLALERFENLAVQGFWQKGSQWDTVKKEAVCRSGELVEIRRI